MVDRVSGIVAASILLLELMRDLCHEPAERLNCSRREPHVVKRVDLLIWTLKKRHRLALVRNYVVVLAKRLDSSVYSQATYAQNGDKKWDDLDRHILEESLSVCQNRGHF